MTHQSDYIARLKAAKPVPQEAEKPAPEEPKGETKPRKRRAKKES